MLDASLLSPALIWMPLTDAEATGQEPIRIGGRPNLPERIDWPGDNAPLHFYAQIDLSALPDRVEGLSLPDMPRTGWLFIFLPLGKWDLWEGEPPVLIHVPEDVRDLPECALPDDLPEIANDAVMPGAVLDGGTCLRPQYAQIKGYLSEPVLAPIHHADLPEIDNPKPLASVLRQPVAPEPRDWVEAALPDSLRSLYGLTEADLDWQRINDLTNTMFTAVAEGVWQTLEEASDLDRGAFEARWGGEVEAFQASAWHYLREDKSQPLYKQWMRMKWMRPTVGGPLDLALIGWMGISAFARGRPSKDELTEWLDLIAHMANPEGADHQVTSEEFPDIRAPVLSEIVHRLWFNLDPDRYAVPSWDEAVIEGTTAPKAADVGFRLAGAGRIPLQMFGMGYCLQNAAWDRAENGDMLLLQIGDAFGSHLAPARMGGLWQIWITQDDLSAGRFDEVELTAEST